AMSTKVVPVPTSLCRFGFARREITPPVGIYHRCWGAATHDRATGIHRPLYADVMVLGPLPSGRTTHDAGRTTETLRVQAQLDLGWIHRREVLPLREGIAAATGLPLEQVLVGCNHSHAAANVMLDRVGEPGGELIRPYLAALREKLMDAARAAV